MWSKTGCQWCHNRIFFFFFFPWLVQIRMSQFQHYRGCWHSTFVSTHHIGIMLRVSWKACFDYFGVFAPRITRYTVVYSKSPTCRCDGLSTWGQTFGKIWKRNILSSNSRPCWDSDRVKVYPSSFAFYCRSPVPSDTSFFTASLDDYTCIHSCLSFNSHGQYKPTLKHFIGYFVYFHTDCDPQ